MRPTKLTNRVLQAFKEVLAESHNAIVCTDYELVFLLNDRLPEDEKISYRTFQRYKAKAIELAEKLTEIPVIYEQLHRLLVKAIILQKNALYEKLIQAASGWQRYKWIFEMKLNEWNTHIHKLLTADKEQEEEQPKPMRIISVGPGGVRTDVTDELELEAAQKRVEFLQKRMEYKQKDATDH